MPVAVRGVQVVVVAVIRPGKIILLGWFFMLPIPAFSAVLPEDRADVLSHSYQGGGMDITGPSILVRKGDDKAFSAYANYYVDNISSASIDVQALGASQYKEERIEQSAGVDILHDKSIMSLGVTSSEENDFVSDSYHVGISMDMFGDLTTVSMGFSKVQDQVFKTTTIDGTRTRDPSFSEDAIRRYYRLGLSQVVTKNLLFGLNFESISDEGYLNNPYRQYRYAVSGGDAFETEVYPRTRTSNAFSMQARYFLPYRAAIHYQQRTFSDDWGIAANDSEVGYTHPLGENFIIELRYRLYAQTKADFYSDLHAERSSQLLDFRARDKELSTYNSTTLGLVLSYEFAQSGWGFIDKASVNLVYDHMEFEYEDFRDARVSRDDSSLIGNEPAYQFSANVVQLFLSVWY